jgi:cytidylate kinase
MGIRDDASAGSSSTRRYGRLATVEVAGPAGSGKSTLARTLARLEPNITLIPLLHRWEMAPLYARRVIPLLPTYLRRYRGTPWFTKQEGRAIALLDGWCRRVDGWADPEGNVGVFSQGPIFRLAVLGKLGPPIARSPAVDRLLDEWMREWRDRLDIVVWLDAPGHVLLDRIRSRPKDHAVKNWADAPALERIGRYRDALDETVEEIVERPIVRLEFDSSRLSPEELAEEVLATLRHERLIGG